MVSMHARKRQEAMQEVLPSRRFAFHTRVVRADKALAARAHSHGLCGAQGINSLQCTPAFFKLAQHVFTNTLFNDEFVRFPLMMKSRLSQSRCGFHAEINCVEDRQN